MTEHVVSRESKVAAILDAGFIQSTSTGLRDDIQVFTQHLRAKTGYVLQAYIYGANSAIALGMSHESLPHAHVGPDGLLAAGFLLHDFEPEHLRIAVLAIQQSYSVEKNVAKYVREAKK